jgi:hypothetical protein
MDNSNFSETIKNNVIFKFVSKCYLHIISLIIIILFLTEFFYLYKNNPSDIMKGDFFHKYLNISNSIISKTE